MTILSEEQHALAFMISSAPHTRSIDQVTILAGSGSARTLTAGMVLGRRIGGTATATAGASNTGTGAMGAITVSAGARPGRYVLTIVEPASNAGAFTLEDPSGSIVGHGNVASAFSGAGLAFTLADATDFLAGDIIYIDVVPTSEKWLRHDPTATTGEQFAAGILCYDATAADAVDGLGVIVARDAEVNAAELTYSSGANAAAKALANRELALQGIQVR